MEERQQLDSLLRQANEIYQSELTKLQKAKGGKPKSEVAQLRAQQLFGLEGGSFCQTAPGTVQSIEGEINMFSWFIPDNIELPIMAFLKTCDFLLPKLCETAGVAPAKPKPSSNISQKAR